MPRALPYSLAAKVEHPVRGFIMKFRNSGLHGFLVAPLMLIIAPLTWVMIWCYKICWLLSPPRAKKEKLALLEMLDGAVNYVRSPLGPTQTQIWSARQVEPLYVYADFNQLGQALGELFRCARIKGNPARWPGTVELKREGVAAILTVTHCNEHLVPGGFRKIRLLFQSSGCTMQVRTTADSEDTCVTVCLPLMLHAE